MIDIYVITNAVNNKKYVGQSINSSNRWKEHKRQAKKGIEYPIYYAMRKHGLDNFSMEVIEMVKDREEANEKETFWISELKTQDSLFGYNIKAGGAKGPLPDSMKKDISEGLIEYHASMSEEEKENRINKLRSAAKEQFSSEENREKHKELMTQWNSQRLKEDKEITSERQSKSQKERHASKTIEQKEETGRKISKSLLNNSVSGILPKNFEETREKSRIREAENIKKRDRDEFGRLKLSDPKKQKTPEEYTMIEAKRIESLKAYFAKKRAEEISNS
jgi:group I intron endonuclease